MVKYILIKNLEKILCEMKNDRIAVLLSGGVDSAYLALSTRRVIGDNAVALTAVSPLLSAGEMEDAKRLCDFIGIEHFTLVLNELENETFAANPKDKCYTCKKMRLEKISAWAAENKIKWLLDGSNTDDLGDYRPGMKALKEFSNVRSPLLEAGMTKQDIRDMSKEAGLFTWRKPAAACLASRIASNQRITREALSQVERAEDFLRAILPPHSQFRVRHHGDIARIEADASHIPLIVEKNTNNFLKELGFRHATIDLAGYKTGSLNS